MHPSRQLRILAGLLLAPLLARPVVAQAVAPPSPATARALGGLDQFVTSVMREWHVPGLAIGVIQDGRPVLLKGYGLRDLEHQLPVTPRTLMAIGSNSKSFTVVLMGMLVDSGKLDWDKPVRDYLADFQLHDEFASREMTPRDLVTHRSGLPRHDLFWYGGSLSRQEMYRRLKYLEPNASFRSRWQYQNLMFMTAGYLVEQRTGRSWDDLIRERLFGPLGMTRSNTSVRDLPASDDAALAYVWRPCRADHAAASGSAPPPGGPGGPSAAACGLVKVPYRSLDAIAPAGSINSSVDEMLHYVQFHIDSGRYDGRTILSKQNDVQMQTPQMLVGHQDIWPDEFGVASYGLGLAVTVYRGHKLVQHGGGIDGFISQMSWMPQERIGIVVLTNMSGDNPVPNIVTEHVFDQLLRLSPIDWAARARKEQQDAEAEQKKQRDERAAARKPNTTPSHELAAYAGTYEHPGYGRLTVRAVGHALELSYADYTARLKHYHYDTFEVDDPDEIVPLSGLIAFLMNRKGEIDRVAVPFEPSVKDIEFVRVQNP
ncbi:MAG TPA: serine hydrolase [Gemmatimonadales bacterium]|jgi:CubicO group peptidase (beta-lactamase class C family)